MCFLIIYHYKTNAILALPIKGFCDAIIFEAYKQQFNLLQLKRYKIKLNVMDNQATQIIKKILIAQECNLLLVKPHNRQVNAVKRMFKDHYISTIATSDSKFPLQLWDHLTPQVENTLSILRPSCINPEISAYEAVYGPYDWNRFPLAPLGCKAVIYESPEAQSSWGSKGTNTWYAGPSFNHYQCSHYFVPKTRAYWISGSAKLFPQHCQVPFLMWNEHLQEVSEELVTTLHELPVNKQMGVLKTIKKKLKGNPKPEK